MEGYLIRWLTVCFFLLVILLLSSKLLRAKTSQNEKQTLIKKLETVYLSRGCFLHLVKLGQEKLILISETAQRSSLICELDLKELNQNDLDLISALEQEKRQTKASLKEFFYKLKS